MLEAIFVGSIIVLAAVIAFLGAEALCVLGGLLVVLGFVGGVPAAFVYHLKLLGALKRAGPVPARWWWSPTKHHESVTDEDEKKFAWAFRIGAAGFCAIVVGCLLVGAGLWRMSLQGGTE